MMKIEIVYYVLVPLLLSVIFLLKPRTITDLCDLDTCPYCYGNNMCEDVEKNLITFQYDGVIDFIYNVLSVKNVFFAQYKDQRVVLKKLGHQSEIEVMKLPVDSLTVEVIESLVIGQNQYHPPFCVCDNETFHVFLKNIKFVNMEHLYTLLKINAEPILLQLFNSRENYPVPYFYGSCGRLAIEENCGEPLNNIENLSWHNRAFVAYQLLQAANNFTKNHDLFRLYLTDISPDNIVVSRDLKVSFIDLENAVLRLKTIGSSTVMDKHYTEHLENTYYYSQSSLCGHQLSDHNIYGVCMLLLSNNAPWPMMQGGLLHDPPQLLKDQHKNLFDNIELCVHSEDEIDRFVLSDRIINELEFVLYRNNRH